MFSVVLATYNEEKNLATCLDAVKDIADEIIIVDGESKDQTVAIAHSYNAQIISTTNKTNFHINKQMAMDAAQGDLVLQLDADEIVDAELFAFLNQLKHSPLDKRLPAAWYLKRKNYFFGTFLTKGGQYPDPVIRLYQKGKARLPQENVHEQMVVDGAVDTAPGHLLHYATPTLASYIHKFNRYTSFEAVRIQDELPRTFFGMCTYFILKPCATFFSLFLRHRGYVDGMAGFLFALFSALHHPFVFLKCIELKQLQRP